MMPLIQADWSAVAVLAAISLAEGLQKVPHGAVVLRALGLSEWLVVEGHGRQTGWRLISMWPPFTRHLVLLPRVDDLTEPTRSELQERLERVQRLLPALEALGAFELVALVLGVPVASATFGGTGFLLALGVVVAGVAGCTLLTMHALRRLGYTTGEAWTRARSVVSPFGSSQASEKVLAAVFEQASPVQAARLMMSDGAFRQWIRPAVYDVRQGSADVLGVQVLLDEDERARALVTEPFDGPVCPRCGRTFRHGMQSCVDCGGLALAARARP